MFRVLLKPRSYARNFDNLQQTISNLNLKRLGMGGAVMNRFWVPVLWSTGYLFLTKTGRVKCKDTNQEVEKFQARRDNMKLETVSESKKSVLSTIWSVLCHTLRFFQLIIIFSPVILLFPLRKFNFMKEFWLNQFVKAV